MAELSEIKRVAIDDLKPYENNAKVHNEKQLNKLAESIKQFGFISPVLIDADFNIIAGHGRTEAAKRAGLHEIPCVIADGLTEDQRKAYILADNRLSELGSWDKNLVNLEIESLSGVEFDLGDFKFDLPKPREWYGDERDRTNKAYNLKGLSEIEVTDDFWQMPIIYNDNVIPTDLIGFNYAKTNENKKTGVHFYVDDYQFERIWNDPDKYFDILKEYECILSPDFSLYMDMPMAMKIWNVYRSRFVGALYQMRGIPVIPTISWAEKETFKFAFSGIPKGSIISVSTVGVKRDENARKIFSAGMKQAIRVIEPEAVILYGGNIGFDFKDIRVIEFENKVTENWK